MYSVVELKTATLDYGIPGVSPAHMLLVFVMMYAISLIPYLFLFLSLRDEQRREPMTSAASPILEVATKPFRKLTTWVHVHRHPLLHH